MGLGIQVFINVFRGIMRHLIIAFVLLCSTLNSLSQSIIGDTNEWSILEWNNGFPLTHRLTTNGDTTINSILYKKIFRIPDPLVQQDPYFTGAIREDSTKKVYIWSNSTNSDKLLYDFNLTLGDSFVTTNLWNCPIQVTVDTLDTIVLLNGELRKRYVFSPGIMGTDIWIEGIGSDGGLFGVGGVCFTDFSFGLLCFREDDILKYIYPYFNTCYYPVGIEEPSPDMVAHPFPNPTRGSVSLLDLNELSSTRLTVYNILGAKMDIPETTGTGIDLSSSPDGVYFLRIETENGIVTKKVIKRSD